MERLYINDCEKKLLRSGNICNALGLLRASHCNNNRITRQRFEKLVKINWGVEELDRKLINCIIKAWQQLKEYLESLNLIVKYNKKIIIYKEPDCWSGL